MTRKPKTVNEKVGNNPADTITLNVPLLLRLLEYAKEDAKTDMDLHVVIEKLIKHSQSGGVLDMSHYDSLLPDTAKSVNENISMQPVSEKVKTFIIRKGDRVFGGIKVTEPEPTEIKSEIIDFRTDPDENPLMVLNLAIRTVFKQFPNVKELCVNIPEAKKPLWLKLSPTHIQDNRYVFYRGR